MKTNTAVQGKLKWHLNFSLEVRSKSSNANKSWQQIKLAYGEGKENPIWGENSVNIVRGRRSGLAC